MPCAIRSNTLYDPCSKYGAIYAAMSGGLYVYVRAGELGLELRFDKPTFNLEPGRINTSISHARASMKSK